MAARLPTSVDGVSAPRGAAPSTRTARPTDFGLGDLAEGVMSVGKAFAVRDDRKAQDILRTEQQGFEPQFAERAAQYDGRESGWAARETAAFDDHFKPLLEREDIPQGVRIALSRQVDRYKADFGGRAINVESQRRAGIIGEQQRVLQAQGEAAGMAAFQQTWGPGYQTLADTLDGSKSNHVTQALELFDTSAKAAIEATPEPARAGLQMRMAAQRPTVMAQAMEAQDKAHDGYVVAQVKSTSTAYLNSVVSNPAGYDLAAQNADGLAAGLPARLQRAFVEEYRGNLAGARVEGLILKGDLDAAKAELDDGRYDKVLPPARKAALVGAVRSSSAKRAADMIEAMRYGADVDAQALTAAADLSGDPGLKAHADYALAVGVAEPGALNALGAGARKGGFAEASGFVIDQLEGGDALVLNDNGRGPSRFGINQTANPDLNVATLTRGQAMGRYKRYWAAIGGDRLQPALALVAFDAAVNHGEGAAREMLAEAGGDVGRLLALREARYRDLAKANPGQHGDDLKGWLGRLGKVKTEAARLQAFANVQEGVSSDPIKFALGGGGRAALANVPPLPEQPSGPEFQAALKGRLQVGQMMNATYRAPLRLLTDGEAAQYRDTIERDPMAGVQLAGEALAAVGPVAARSLLGEVGQQGEAAVTIHVADLAAAGLPKFAERAAEGLALKAKGAKLADGELGEIRAEVEAAKAVFAGQPELRGIVQATAEAAMLADSQAGTPNNARAYINSALGASVRNVKGARTYGGLVKLNGADAIIPPWLSAEHADDALEIMAESWAATKRGPVYTDGSPIPADRLRRMRLQLMPRGTYRVLDPRGAAMLGASGRPFEFDFDEARDGLRNRLGAVGVQ